MPAGLLHYGAPDAEGFHGTIAKASRTVDVVLETDVPLIVSGTGGPAVAGVSLQRGEAFDQLNIGAAQKELVRQGSRIR